MFKSNITWYETRGDVTLVICPRVASESIRKAVNYKKTKQIGSKIAYFVRDPYRRAESLFYLHTAPKGSRKPYPDLSQGASFLEFCQAAFVEKSSQDRHWWSMTEYYSGVDPQFLGRLENMPGEWDRFRDWSGWDVPDLGFLHKSDRRDVYCEETREIVYERFKDDFINYGYDKL